MRHFLAARPVATRPIGMREPPSTTGLVAPTGSTLRVAPGSPGAVSGTVDLAAIATAADHALGAAPGTQKQPGRQSGVMRGPPRATWTNRVIAGILSPHACPARCGARRRCGTAKSASAPCLPLRAGTLLRHSSPRQAAHAPQRLIALDDTSSPIRQSRTCLSACASRRPISPHQFRHSAPDLRGSVQPSTCIRMAERFRWRV